MPFAATLPVLGISEGSQVTQAPRFNLRGKSVSVRPYDSAESRDLHLADTYGSGDPFLDTTDEIRFSPRTSLLVSCNIGVPERPTHDSAFVTCVDALPLVRGLPSLSPGHPFQTIVARHTWIDPRGQALAAFKANAPPLGHRLEIATDLELILASGTIVGFVLRHPARHLAKGWQRSTPLDDDTELGRMLSSYINLLDETFLARLDDADPAAGRDIRLLLEQARNLVASHQRDVLIDALETILDTFFGES